MKTVLFVESVFNMDTLINRIKGLVEAGELDVDRITIQKLLKQHIAATSIPFHGEPAIGIQIMASAGKTRNRETPTTCCCSQCNEGNMPKGIRDSSFIPYSIRKAYGLTTVDNKVAILFRPFLTGLLQRAKDITIAYNTSTENGNKGRNEPLHAPAHGGEQTRDKQALAACGTKFGGENRRKV